MLEQPALEHHRLTALDLPGCGQSPYPSDHALDIDALVSIVENFQEALHLRRHLIVGASMGGLVALLCAEHHPGRLVGFVNAEGNLAPEDCMFSRLVVPRSYEAFYREVFPRIKTDLQAQDGRGPAKHLEVLASANPRAYYDFSFQTVSYSDEGRLLDRFLSLPTRLHFVYGSLNRHLGYLSRLRQSSCVITEIEGAGHFLFYDAPEFCANAVAAAAR
jgi:pimeloyl-ACP methyl ester carboxylesterase